MDDGARFLAIRTYEVPIRKVNGKPLNIDQKDVSKTTFLTISPVKRCSTTNASSATPLRVSSLVELNMPTNNLSSLKWNEEGELSPQDIWNLVTKLTKAEDASKASNLLHLSSKHTHARHKKKDKA